MSTPGWIAGITLGSEEFAHIFQLMKRILVCFFLFVVLVEAASAGVLYGVPRVANGYGRRMARLSTAPLRQTNPKIGVATKDNDVSYYFNFRRAEAQYEQAYIRYEKQRFAQADRRRKELERAAARSRRSTSPDVRMMNASAVGAAPSKEITRDPRAWFNSKIAGSFGPRPSDKNVAVASKSSETSKPLRSSSSLLDGTDEAVEAKPKKEGLWSKFLRVLGIKK